MCPGRISRGTAPLIATSFVDSQQVGEIRRYLSDTLAPGEWEKLLVGLQALHKGYAVVTVENPAARPANFDDLRVWLIDVKQLQENHYDPWGLNLVGLEQSPERQAHRFQYNGKEKTAAFGLWWNDHGARTFDLQAPHWGQVDPLAGKYPHLSPYVFGMGNPIRFFDPDGRDIVDANGKRVTIKDGLGVYHPKADASTRAYVEALNKSLMGRETLGRLIDHKTVTRILVNPDRGTGKLGAEVSAYTETKNSPFGQKATINIYLGTYEDQQVNNGSEGSRNEYRGASKEEFINGVGVHEGWHVLNDELAADEVYAKDPANADLTTDQQQEKANQQFEERREVVPNEKERESRAGFVP